MLHQRVSKNYVKSGFFGKPAGPSQSGDVTSAFKQKLCKKRVRVAILSPKKEFSFSSHDNKISKIMILKIFLIATRLTAPTRPVT